MKRYTVQFRDVDQEFFTSDCAFDDQAKAQEYITMILDTLFFVAEGQIHDEETRTVTWAYRPTRKLEDTFTNELLAFAHRFAELPEYDQLPKEKLARRTAQHLLRYARYAKNIVQHY